MITLRNYQQQCSDAILNNMINGNDGGLAVMATGTGKAYTICDVAKRAIEYEPTTRIIQLVHTKELIEQNFKSMIKLWPQAPVGIYSAGLRRRDFYSKILFAGIQSVYNKVELIGRSNIIMVDEAHTISRNANTMYGQFLSEMRALNPNLKLCGFTATPFRTKCGMLHEGDDALFNDIVFEYNIRQAIEEGYLVSPRTKQTKIELNVDGVAKRGGEFVAGQLEAAVDIDETTYGAIQEAISYAGNFNLKKWIVFGAGIKHCENIRDELRRQGIAAEMVTSKTPPKQRDLILQALKVGQITALVNMNVATTGFDDPLIDLVISLRPTGSAGLWLQMVGRGSRLSDPAIGNLPTIEQRLSAISKSEKPFFHVLDFAGNTSRHGPIDMINSEDKRTDGTGEAPIKVCEHCFEMVYAGVKICPNCGEAFPENELKIEKTATSEALLSTQQPERWETVSEIDYEYYESRNGNEMMKVTYYCGLGRIYSEYISPKWPKCEIWWFDRSGNYIPKDLNEVINQAPNLKIPTKIRLEKNGKFWQVIDCDFSQISTPPKIVEREVFVNSNPVFYDSAFDDEIPF